MIARRWFGVNVFAFPIRDLLRIFSSENAQNFGNLSKAIGYFWAIFCAKQLKICFLFFTSLIFFRQFSCRFTGGILKKSEETIVIASSNSFVSHGASLKWSQHGKLKNQYERNWRKKWNVCEKAIEQQLRSWETLFTIYIIDAKVILHRETSLWSYWPTRTIERTRFYACPFFFCFVFPHSWNYFEVNFIAAWAKITIHNIIENFNCKKLADVLHKLPTSQF